MKQTYRLTSKLRRAAQEQISRQNRQTHPNGSFDKAGRFYLTERLACCSTIRDPTRNYPYSENTHGRSMIHVATEFGYSLQALRSAITRIRKEQS